jgi:NADPH:quinone reductase-like Zn-dependent oxidoreductase
MVPAHAFWILEPGRGEIRDASFEEPAGGQAIVRALFSGISRGTESRVFKGLIPPSEYQRMRAPFQDGDFPGPVKYGYASVGIVERGPADVAGRAVFVLYPHQTRYAVPVAALHLIPDAVPPGRAVLAANLETAINTLWDARPHVGDRIAVIGGGAVGCLVAWLAARIAGCRVELVDVNRARAEVADALGVAFAEPSSASGEADLVIHASGAPEGLALALRLAAFEATVVEVSWFGSASVTLPLGEAFHARRLTIRSSQVGHVPPAQRARWTMTRRLALAMSLLTEPALDRLITGESAFDELPQVMAQLAARPGDTLCHRIRY